MSGVIKGPQYWSPGQLQVVLHHHVSPEPYPNNETNWYRETVESFVSMGVLDRSDFPHTTERGKVFVEMLCMTPIPIVRYTDPRFDK